jgi:hypothetical protein
MLSFVPYLIVANPLFQYQDPNLAGWKACSIEIVVLKNGGVFRQCICEQHTRKTKNEDKLTHFTIKLLLGRVKAGKVAFLSINPKNLEPQNWQRNRFCVYKKWRAKCLIGWRNCRILVSLGRESSALSPQKPDQRNIATDQMFIMHSVYI